METQINYEDMHDCLVGECKVYSWIGRNAVYTTMQEGQDWGERLGPLILSHTLIGNCASSVIFL